MYLFYFYIILFYIIYQTTHSNNVMFYSYIIFLTGEIYTGNNFTIEDFKY